MSETPESETPESETVASANTESGTPEWTVDRLLTWTQEYLAARGSDEPRLEADLLLAHACECKRIDLYAMKFKEVVPEEQRTVFRGLVKRRGEGVPTAYLLESKEFYSLTFRVTSDVLVPRPETEHLVIGLLDEAKARHARRSDVNETITVADVGTGSGVIAVCAAKYLPDAEVTALDVSSAALEVAHSNAELHEVADRVSFVESDLLAALPAESQFDFILSNPPYITADEYDDLPPLIKDHEPKVALLGGENGCDLIERLIPEAAERLKPGGWLMMEISPMIEADVHNLITADGRFDQPVTTKDLAGWERIVSAKLK